MSYLDRLKYVNLPTLHFKRCRGDMTETLEIIRKIYDEETVPKFSNTKVNRTAMHLYPICYILSFLTLTHTGYYTVHLMDSPPAYEQDSLQHH